MPRIVLNLSMEQTRVLQLLSVHSDMGGKTVQGTIEYILSSIEDGALRPGSWEGELVRRLFGDEFTRKLDPDPVRPWRLSFQSKLALNVGDESHVTLWRIPEDGEVPSTVRDKLRRQPCVPLPKPTDDGMEFASLEDPQKFRGLPILFAFPVAPAIAAFLQDEKKGTRKPSEAIRTSSWRSCGTWRR